jgi:hypothetical protein
MQKAVRMVWSGFVTACLAVVIFFIFIGPAKAPKGDKHSLGGRTIASIQEEDFDRTLQRYNICYGVRFAANQATPERRRVCKAILVHRLEQSLAETGTYFPMQVEFRCENTAMGRKIWYDDLNQPVVALQPNAEFDSIEDLIKQHLDRKQVSASVDNQVRDACQFISRCKRALRFETFSIRRVASCFTDDDSLHRRMMVDTISDLVFPKAKEKLLVADLLHELQ